jgi:YD repeat-containing protein
MGRVTIETYCTPQNCGYTNAVSAGYDLAGNMTSLTYPDGRVVQQVFDSASHLTTVNYQSWNGETVGTSYLSAIGYDPVGHPTSATMGNGVVRTGAYNTRLEPKSLGYANSSSVNLWNKTFLWTKNGNLEQAADTVAGTTRQYNYDTLNRLIGAQDIHGSSTGQTTNTSGQNQSNTLVDSQREVGHPMRPQWPPIRRLHLMDR